jgi:adenosylcobinamide-GDP ribazoletransferase
LKGLLREIKAIASLTSFLTIIPTGRNNIVEASEGFYSAPMVGALIGLISSIPLLTPHLPGTLRGALAFTLLYGLTGLIHLDGLADFLDALSSGRAGEEALRIMKQPCRGAKAVAGTAAVLIITYGSLTAFPADMNSLYLLTISQLAAYEGLYIMATLANPSPYEGLGKLFINASKTRRSRIFNAFAFALIAIFINSICWDVLTLLSTLISMAITLAVVGYSITQANRVVGFVNGDIIGYALEISRTTSIAGIALLSRFFL